MPGVTTELTDSFDSLDLATVMVVLNALPVAAFLLDEEKVHCNRAATQLTGYDSRDLPSVSSFFSTLCLLDDNDDQGKASPRDASILCKDGTRRSVRITSSGSRRLLCCLQEVTGIEASDAGRPVGQKCAQSEPLLKAFIDSVPFDFLQALRESEDRYRRFSGLTSDYVYCCRRTLQSRFRVMWLGGAIEEITGYSEAEVFDKGCWISFVHPADRDRVASRLLGLRGGESSSDEFRIVCKDGDIRWIRESCRCEAGAEPDELLLFGAAQNITESKHAELALKNKEEVFRLFLEYSPAYVVFKDENQRIMRLSKNFESIFDRPLSEVLGRTAAEVLPPEAAEVIRQDDLKVLSDGKPSQQEEEVNGRFYSSLRFPIPQDNKPSLMGVIKIDITARKEAEDALSRLNELLDRRVAERTAQLEAAILEQESFSYSVSHDLRAPLRHINSFSAIVLEDYAVALPPEGRNYLNRICQATKRMGVLIDNLLKMSRISRTLLNRSSVNLSEIASTLALMLKEIDPERAVEFTIAPDLFANCDKGLVQQLLQNLLGNAWKYTARKTVANIEFGAIASKEGTVFFVRDNGAGFDMIYKDKLFLPFQRLHGAEYEGNGIGLATVQRIIQHHGGTIWAEGEEGAGASFYFTLP